MYTEKQIINLLSSGGMDADILMKKLINSGSLSEKKHFFPILSGLSLKNIICSNWILDANGRMKKQFHLTFKNQ